MKWSVVFKFGLILITFSSIISIITLRLKNRLPFSTIDKRDVENIVLIDSVSLDNINVYWYCFDIGLTGYSDGRVSVCQNGEKINEDNTILISNEITGISPKGMKVLQIEFIPEAEFNLKEIKSKYLKNFEVEYIFNGNYKDLYQNRLNAPH